ncbi:LysM peptidoglycan-binding domain-containing protein [Acidipila sp. EB88]|uniref:LysM peptidoglycan-binding domain-containing protein n=1 Tax=Acidipila sp. EB88 TaxID=2305226 RepID=UPI000F5F9D9D|nr:LysM peptidoglycan-binding domain-containing protein [Acidipila sp. EB88]RRA48213.1 LysM peptidoglycan-binding domain-containing protein [Acidipila sp. EB88]
MADLQQLKTKYAPVLALFPHFAPQGAQLQDASLDGDKLLLKGSVPSTVIANRVWDVIKQVDPAFSDLHHEIATTGGAEQPYTIAAGDNLSKVSQYFYGSASHYEKIAQANNISDPNKIHAGQQINIPVLS